MNELNVPRAMTPYVEQVVEVTDEVCRALLDEEYAELCRAMVAKLARKRPSPLVRGDLRIWAAGVVYAVGQVNFLSDPAQSPQASADRLSDRLGVKKTTMANKAKMIRDALKIGQLDPEFMRREVLAANPLIWLLLVDGLLVDIRRAPRSLQQRAVDHGLIPFLPDEP